jgi:hypothetical protein
VPDGKESQPRHVELPSGDPLERDDFSSNRHPALASCLSMIFSRKPLHTFRDHALALLMRAIPLSEEHFART